MIMDGRGEGIRSAQNGVTEVVGGANLIEVEAWIERVSERLWKPGWFDIS